MRWSPSNVLGAVTPHLPELLVGNDQLQICRRIADELQTSIRSYYLECRLNDDPQIDFLVLTGDRMNVARQLEALLGGERCAGAWRRNLSLLRGWAGADPGLDGAPLVWFEYDLDGRFDVLAPVASPSLCVEEGYFSRFEGNPSIDQLAARRRAGAAVKHLVSGSRQARISPVIEDCIAALPEGGSLVYVSEMLTRQPNVTKLYLALPKVSVTGFLSRVGWPGDMTQASEILDTYYAEVSSTVFIDLSVTDELIKRIGFAFSQFHQREMRCFDPCWRWMPMPGVNPHKRDALALWPGESEVVLDGSRCVLRRWVDIKVVVGDTHELSFKAYLGFMPAFRRLLVS